MKRDVLQVVDSFHPNTHFLSCEKDCETILRRLFIETSYKDDLKRLLVINMKDCLDNTTSEIYKKKIDEMSLAKLREDGYIRLEPKFNFSEHEEVKAYLYLSFDNFTPSSNPEFRDCTVNFDILCHTDQWDIGGFRCRPLKIAGIIDRVLNNSRLSGIGTFQFTYCTQLILDENISGYVLSYRAVHGSDDEILPVE